jgi:hypothetical protein
MKQLILEVIEKNKTIIETSNNKQDIEEAKQYIKHLENRLILLNN